LRSLQVVFVTLSEVEMLTAPFTIVLPVFTRAGWEGDGSGGLG
jgi:hypothetical protein